MKTIKICDQVESLEYYHYLDSAFEVFAVELIKEGHQLAQFSVGLNQR